jgi:hypothetical protein
MTCLPSPERHSVIKKAFALFVIAAAASAVAQTQDISGDWQGTIQAGMGELRLVLHVSKNADGTLKAVIDSPDQNAAGVAIDSISLDGNKVRFASAPLKATYEGTLKGESINGSWTQGQKLPLDFKKTTSPVKLQHKPAPPSDIDGKWEGALDTPEGKLRIVFHVTNTEDGLVATMDSPDQKVNGWPATSVTRKGASVKIAMRQMGGYFQGKISKDLDSMSGDWSQGGADIPLMLKRTKSEPAEAQKK